MPYLATHDAAIVPYLLLPFSAEQGHLAQVTNLTAESCINHFALAAGHPTLP